MVVSASDSIVVGSRAVTVLHEDREDDKVDVVHADADGYDVEDEDEDEIEESKLDL
jgi:tryptophan synthase alpha subunit